MADLIKNVLSYGEQRRTLFLNAHNKDDYGRHRAHVLYGLDLQGAGTKIQISPGAVYTSQGQRLFFEVTDREIDIGPSTIDAFNAALYPNYPICVLLYLKYQFQVPRVANPIDIATSGPTKADLRARIVPYDKGTCAPAYNLLPHDPVNLDELQPSTYPHLSNASKPSIDHLPSQNPLLESIQFGEIPLGYVLIGVDPLTNLPAINLDAGGVSIVTYKNAFESVSDMIGQDALLPVQSTRVVAGLVQAIGSALKQGYSDRVVGGAATSPQLMNPLYGTPNPGPSGTREDSTHVTYREASFLADGAPLLEALRRFDVVLRQWMNRTGSQDLVSLTKDGAGNIIPQFSPLDALIRKLDGSLNAATPSIDGNANSVLFDNGVAVNVVNPNNHAIKSGLIVHEEQTLLGKLNTPEGDSHETAIAALDVALYNVIERVLGETVPRDQLRDVTGASFVPASYDEKPEGRALMGRPIVGGTAASIYQLTPSFRLAIAEALTRTLSGVSLNWLANYGFWAGDANAGTQATPPAFWQIDIGTGNWGRAEHAANGRTGKLLTVSLGANSIFAQNIVGAANDNYIGAALSSSRHISFSAVMQNSGPNPIIVRILGYSDAAGTVPVFSLTTQPIAAGAGVARIVSATAVIGASDIVNNVKFQILAVTPGDICTFTIAGAALNAGMPISVAELCSLPTDFVSRDGGADKPMRGHLYMGAKQVKDAADATLATDLTTLQQVTAAILVETNARIAAVTAEANARIAADNAEASTRLAADNVLTANLAAETARAIAAENTKQLAAVYDGTAYVDLGLVKVGESVKLNVAGIDRFVPSWPNAAGPCHSNCHSNCNHSDCGRGSW